MNRYLFLAAALFGALMPLVFDSALKGAVLLATAALVALVLWRASAAARHLVWLVAIVALLVVPVLSLALPQWRVLPQWAVVERGTKGTQMTKGTTAPTLFEDWQPVSEDEPFSEAPQPLAASAPLPTVAFVPLIASAPSVPRPWSFREYLPLAWCVGFAVLAVRLFAAHLLLRRASRHCPALTAPPDEKIAAAFADACKRLGIRQRITLLLDKKRTIPVVWGVFRPRLMLPLESREWSDEQLFSVLLHELGHIKRRDTLVQWLTQIACALHWWNPLVWLAAWRLHTERERACDDLVLASGVRPSAYAEHLLDVATRLTPARWTSACGLAMARKSSLEGRLLAVLSDKLSRRSVTRALAIAALILGACIAVPVAMLRAADEKAADEKPKTRYPMASDIYVMDPAAFPEGARLYSAWNSENGKTELVILARGKADLKSDSNRIPTLWTDAGVFTLGNGEKVEFERSHKAPDVVSISGKNYDLGKGRVFVLNPQQQILQCALFPGAIEGGDKARELVKEAIAVVPPQERADKLGAVPTKTGDTEAAAEPEKPEFKDGVLRLGLRSDPDMWLYFRIGATDPAAKFFVTVPPGGHTLRISLESGAQPWWERLRFQKDDFFPETLPALPADWLKRGQWKWRDTPTTEGERVVFADIVGDDGMASPVSATREAPNNRGPLPESGMNFQVEMNCRIHALESGAPEQPIRLTKADAAKLIAKAGPALSKPRVTTKSGQQAVIEIIREYRYKVRPDEWEVTNTGVTFEAEPNIKNATIHAKIQTTLGLFDAKYPSLANAIETANGVRDGNESKPRSRIPRPSDKVRLLRANFVGDIADGEVLILPIASEGLFPGQAIAAVSMKRLPLERKREWRKPVAPGEKTGVRMEGWFITFPTALADKMKLTAFDSKYPPHVNTPMIGYWASKQMERVRALKDKNPDVKIEPLAPTPIRESSHMKFTSGAAEFDVEATTVPNNDAVSLKIGKLTSSIFVNLESAAICTLEPSADGKWQYIVVLQPTTKPPTAPKPAGAPPSIQILRDGSFLIEGKKVSRDEAAAKAKDAVAIAKLLGLDGAIKITAEKDAPYAVARELLEALKASGVNAIDFLPNEKISPPPANGAGERRKVDWSNPPPFSFFKGKYDPELLARLAGQPERLSEEISESEDSNAGNNLWMLSEQILRAAVERDPQFRHSLTDEKLKAADNKARILTMSLAVYDFSVFGNKAALKVILDRLSDGTSEAYLAAFPLGFVDEWDASIAGIDRCFIKADGAKGEEYTRFWVHREWLFPESFAAFQRKKLVAAGAPKDDRQNDPVKIWTPEELVKKYEKGPYDMMSEFVVEFRVNAVVMQPTVFPDGTKRDAPKLVPANWSSRGGFCISLPNEVEAELKKQGVSDLTAYFVGKLIRIKGKIDRAGLRLPGRPTIWSYHINLRSLDQLLEVRGEKTDQSNTPEKPKAVAKPEAASVANPPEKPTTPKPTTPKASAAPERSQLSNDRFSTVAYQTAGDVNFVLIHQGFISTGLSESSSDNGKWSIEGNIHLVDTEKTKAAGQNVDKRKVALNYTSEAPGTLFLDGKDYDLKTGGRTFILREQGAPEQMEKTMPLRDKADLEKLGELIPKPALPEKSGQPNPTSNAGASNAIRPIRSAVAAGSYRLGSESSLRLKRGGENVLLAEIAFSVEHRPLEPNTKIFRDENGDVIRAEGRMEVIIRAPYEITISHGTKRIAFAWQRGAGVLWLREDDALRRLTINSESKVEEKKFADRAESGISPAIDEALARALDGAPVRPSKPAQRAQKAPDAKIEPEDVLEVFVTGLDGLSGRYEVDAGGRITLLGLGTHLVSGLSPVEATDALTKIFSKPQPETGFSIKVTISHAGAPVAFVVYLNGEFKNPKAFTVPPNIPHTLSAILDASGGASELGDLTMLRVLSGSMVGLSDGRFRVRHDGAGQVTVDMSEIRSGKIPDVSVRNRSIIVIPSVEDTRKLKPGDSFALIIPPLPVYTDGSQSAPPLPKGEVKLTVTPDGKLIDPAFGELEIGDRQLLDIRRELLARISFRQKAGNSMKDAEFNALWKDWKREQASVK